MQTPLPLMTGVDRLGEELDRDVRAGRLRRVVAPGGFGKSHLLDIVAQRLADLAPERWGAGVDPPLEPDGDRPVLIDDAHLFDTGLLRAVVAARPGAVLAHRPVRDGRAAALDLLDRTPVVLAPLEHESARDLLASQWGERPTPTAADGLLVATGGVPRLLRAVTSGGPTAWPRCTPALEELLHAERRALSHDAVRVMLGVAVLDGVARDTIARACGLDVSGFDHAYLEVVHAGLAVATETRLLPVVADAMARVWSDAELSDLAERAAEAALAGDQPIVVAERLLAVGARGPMIGRCLTRAAYGVAAVDPVQARELLSAAERAGATRDEVACTRAVVAFHDGRLDDTLSGLSGSVATHVDGATARGARRAVASVLAIRGAWSRAAALVAPGCGAADADLAALCHLAAGEVDQMVEVAADERGSASPGHGAVSALVSGLLASTRSDAGTCLHELLDAVRLEDLAPSPIALPELPSAVAAIVAVNLGELDIAADLLDQPISGVAPWGERRRRLLAAWVALRRGDWNGADALLDQLHASPTWSGADPRDRLLADSIRAGSARRRGGLDTLLAVWRRARAELLRTPPDVLSLGPVGELLIAGARLGDHGTVRSYRDRVDDLLARAGEPPLWALPVRWDQLHLAVALDDQPAARAAADRLAALPAAGPRAAVVAQVAGVWVDALGGNVEVKRVRTAAQSLADIALVWEASRLAGAAAIRARDGEQMRALLHFARGLPAPAAPSLVDGAGELSGREQEVAAHLLAGLTYRQIGAQLFIAPKTVEHHVARLRRKLGVSSREELLLVLRRHLPVGSPDGS